MDKHEELNLKFHKKAGPFNEIGYILDSSSAVGEYKRLDFIDVLSRVVVMDLIDTITLIQNNQPYDPYFLSNAEEFSVFDVIFSNPYFFIDGYQTIHMNDLKLVLQEWLVFRNS